MRGILIEKKRQERPKKTCTCCGEEKAQADYYKSNSYINKATKRLAVCKDCTLKVFDNNRRIYKKDIKRSVMETCRVLDMYFEDILFDATMTEITGTKHHIMKRYITKVNSLSGVKDLTFADSKIQTDVAQRDDLEYIEVSDELIETWGEGFPVHLYKRFKKLYYDIAPIYNVDNALKNIYLIKFVKSTILADYYLSEGDLKKSQEYNTMASNTAREGQLSPKEFSKIANGGLNSVSEIIKLVEEEVDIISVMPIYQQQPKDRLDFVIWCLVNYLRRLEDMPEIEYKDLWEFYNKMEEDKRSEILDLAQQINDSDDEDDEDDYDDYDDYEDNEDNEADE